MADRTSIEWCDASWNPIRARDRFTGQPGWFCEIVSPGCEHCYAAAINHRLGTGGRYLRQAREKYEIYIDERALRQPMRWRRARKIFVCSMSDLFGEWVSDPMIDRVFAVAALCPQHTFIVLTKRSARMRGYLAARRQTIGPPIIKWPLPNFWLLVSAEDQRRADERIPDLLATPAAVRGVSYEPALGPIDLGSWTWHLAVRADGSPGLDWMIAGGESGPGARPMHPTWARAIRDQCVAAGVPFFFKQWGEWAPYKPVSGGNLGRHVRSGCVRIVHPSGRSDVEISIATAGHNTEPGSRYMARVGKRAAGRLLDGREWSEFPR